MTAAILAAVSLIAPLPANCERAYTRAEAKPVIRRIYRSPAPLTLERRRVAREHVRCQYRPVSRRLTARWRQRWSRWRRSYTGMWQIREARLSPEVRAMLARLRGCETRGIPFPANYRYDGHHDGAYQYTVSTWQRAQAWYPKRVLGWTAAAYDASPAHQDVVTAFFFPAHRAEWACSA